MFVFCHCFATYRFSLVQLAMKIGDNELLIWNTLIHFIASFFFMDIRTRIKYLCIIKYKLKLCFVKHENIVLSFNISLNWEHIYCDKFSLIYKALNDNIKSIAKLMDIYEWHFIRYFRASKGNMIGLRPA